MFRSLKNLLSALFSKNKATLRSPHDRVRRWNNIKIYDRDPRLLGFQAVPPHPDGFPGRYAIDAYPADNFFFANEAKKLAAVTVATFCGVPPEKVLDLFDIYIVPAFGFHGTIMYQSID